jgi:putative GTP pyrophosphokinase
MTLADNYRHRFTSALVPIAEALEQQLHSYLSEELHIDRISARAKSVDRFLDKAAKAVDGSNKYSDPLNQIQDQIGARIITFYVSDIKIISSVVEKYYRVAESKTVVPDSEWEFGYFGKHYIALLPRELIDPSVDDESLIPEFFELQIKTLFQHAWSEANHDLGYKPGSEPLKGDEKRRLAYTAAQAWGADRVFDELYQERSKVAGSGKDGCDAVGK